MEKVLKDGTVITIDEQDAHFLDEHSWRKKIISGLAYIRATRKVNGKAVDTYLSHLLCDIKIVSFANDNRFDFRRANLVRRTYHSKNVLLPAVIFQQLYCDEMKSVEQIRTIYFERTGDTISAGHINKILASLNVTKRDRLYAVSISSCNSPEHIKKMSAKAAELRPAQRVLRHHITRTCSNCGVTLRRRGSDFIGNHSYCSKQCQSLHSGVIRRLPINVKHSREMERARAKRRIRNVRMANAKGSHTSQQWLDLCKSFDDRCLSCGKRGRLSEDHIIPISRNGTDYISNIQPLCISCNCKKGTQVIDFRFGVGYD